MSLVVKIQILLTAFSFCDIMNINNCVFGDLLFKIYNQKVTLLYKQTNIRSEKEKSQWETEKKFLRQNQLNKKAAKPRK